MRHAYHMEVGCNTVHMTGIARRAVHFLVVRYRSIGTVILNVDCFAEVVTNILQYIQQFIANENGVRTVMTAKLLHLEICRYFLVPVFFQTIKTETISITSAMI